MQTNNFIHFQADLSQPLELGILLENFTNCKELVIPPGTQDYRVKIRLYDTANRLLELWVQIKAGLGGSLRVSIVSQSCLRLFSPPIFFCSKYLIVSCLLRS